MHESRLLESLTQADVYLDHIIYSFPAVQRDTHIQPQGPNGSIVADPGSRSPFQAGAEIGKRRLKSPTAIKKGDETDSLRDLPAQLSREFHERTSPDGILFSIQRTHRLIGISADRPASSGVIAEVRRNGSSFGSDNTPQSSSGRQNKVRFLHQGPVMTVTRISL